MISNALKAGDVDRHLTTTARRNKEKLFHGIGMLTSALLPAGSISFGKLVITSQAVHIEVANVLSQNCLIQSHGMVSSLDLVHCTSL